jgi:hypothetical protein
MISWVVSTRRSTSVLRSGEGADALRGTSAGTPVSTIYLGEQEVNKSMCIKSIRSP